MLTALRVDGQVPHAVFCAREPHKVCELCSSVLAPLQPTLVETLSRASQAPVHDVTDSTSIAVLAEQPTDKVARTGHLQGREHPTGSEEGEVIRHERTIRLPSLLCGADGKGYSSVSAS